MFLTRCRNNTIHHAANMIIAPKLMLEQSIPFNTALFSNLPNALIRILNVSGFMIHIQAGRNVFFFATR